MTFRSKNSIRLLLFGIVIFVVFVSVLYYTIKTKTRNLNDYEPFKPLIGKSFILNEPVYLVEDISGTSKEKSKEYPYKMVSTKERYSASFDNLLHADPPYYKLIDSLPKDAKIHFHQATIFTNGVSGGSQIYLFGLIEDKGKTRYISYLWGDQKMSRIYENEEKTWKFPVAPWQNQEDLNYYKIPDGIW